jgi:glycosyltransferase involved in cell wall biosynthesis
MENPFISIVSPIYKAQDIAESLTQVIEHSIKNISQNYEIILVEDGSPDDSWQTLQKIATSNPKVKALKLSRNFGQHYAITAGLDKAEGEWVVVMDCDLQDRPEEIPRMLEIAHAAEAKIILAQRVVRKDNRLKIWLSSFFYRILSYLSGADWDPTIANFGLYHRDVIKEIKRMREPIRFFPAMVKSVGFNTVKMPVTHHARDEGESSYTLKKRVKLATDIILANSDKPLRIIVKFGLTVSLAAALIGLYYIIRYFSGQTTVLGFTSIMISIWFVGGLIFMLLGIIGLYIGKIFEAAKGRPIYIIEETIN